MSGVGEKFPWANMLENRIGGVDGGINMIGSRPDQPC
jgi:hypothetical protein